MFNSISTRPFEMETKNKTMRVCLKPKVNNIVLIGQYRVVHRFNKSQHCRPPNDELTHQTLQFKHHQNLSTVTTHRLPRPSLPI